MPDHESPKKKNKKRKNDKKVLLKRALARTKSYAETNNIEKFDFHHFTLLLILTENLKRRENSTLKNLRSLRGSKEQISRHLTQNC